MANSMFSFGDFNVSLADDRHRHGSWQVLDDLGFGCKRQQLPLYEEIAFENNGSNSSMYSFCPGFGDFVGSMWTDGNILLKNQRELDHSASNYGPLDSILFDFESSATQTSSRDVASSVAALKGNRDVEFKNEKAISYSMASLELLKCFRKGHRKLDTRKIVASDGETVSTMDVEKKLSPEEVVRLAGAKFIQTSSTADDHASPLGHPYGTSFSCQSEEEKREVQLIELLFSCAEKVCEEQFDRARTLLNQCICLSSREGNAIQRLVYYFADAFLERIARETGMNMEKDGRKKEAFNLALDMSVMSPKNILIACLQAMPFCQVPFFAGAQTVIENVANAKKVHAIDFLIGSGLHWTILMQSLVARQDFEHLRITAVGTTSEDMIKKTGCRLAEFAQSLKVPFSFKLVMVPDMLDLKTDSFEEDPEEVVVVCSQYFLRTMIGQQHLLEHVMKVIKSLDPSLMVVTEVEGNDNSPRLVNRFVESFFFYSAYFECLEACMKEDDRNRSNIESLYFGQAIRNVVAAEGAERTIRSVKIDVWRAFFARYGMVETELGSSSLYQADLLVKKFTCGKLCTLGLNGKSLLVGWKGTPISSLSVWKFT